MLQNRLQKQVCDLVRPDDMICSSLCSQYGTRDFFQHYTGAFSEACAASGANWSYVYPADDPAEPDSLAAGGVRANILRNRNCH